MTSTAVAIDRLRDASAKVSSHYVVDELGKILQLVPEARRAWHAGVSSWEGESDINSRSIGIEIGNPGHSYGYPDFPEPQIESAVALCRDIVARHRIRPDHVLGIPTWRRIASSTRARNSRGSGCIAPASAHGWHRRRSGPVRCFARRYRSGGRRIAGRASPLRLWHQATGIFDESTAAVVTAFQRHFRPDRVDGCADASTIQTLRALRGGL